MLSKQAQHLLLILWTTSLLLSGCTKTFPVRTKENISTYQKCKVQQNPQACFELAEEISEDRWEHAYTGNMKNTLDHKITFYLKRSCELKRWDSCAMLGYWLAHLEKPCSSIEQSLKKGCQHGSWRACTILALQRRHSTYVRGPLVFLLKKARCLATNTEFKQVLTKAYCMAARKYKETSGEPILMCKKKYSQTEEVYLTNAFSNWFGGLNKIYHLISKDRKWGRYNYTPEEKSKKRTVTPQ